MTHICVIGTQRVKKVKKCCLCESTILLGPNYTVNKSKKAKKNNFEILIFHVSQKNKGSSNAPDPRALGSDQDPEHKFLCQNLEK